jgi:hypothetical protein
MSVQSEKCEDQYENIILAFCRTTGKNNFTMILILPVKLPNILLKFYCLLLQLGASFLLRYLLKEEHSVYEGNISIFLNLRFSVTSKEKNSFHLGLWCRTKSPCDCRYIGKNTPCVIQLTSPIRVQ